jgi:hypothetical protein
MKEDKNQTTIGFEKQNNSPASSVTIALPTGCVAPVTTQTKPYCEVTEVSVLLDALTASHLRPISNSDQLELWRARNTPKLTSFPSALYGEKCSDSVVPGGAADVFACSAMLNF